jgi:hypothetical protein
MISTKNNFLFIHVPKTGGNSISRALEKYSDDKIICFGKNIENFDVTNDYYYTTKHTTLSHYKEILDEDLYNDLYKFCVIRNPWEIVISYYFYFTWNWRDFNESSVDGGAWDENLFKYVIDKYINPLRYYICTTENSDLTIEIDKILKFENLNNDFRELLNDLKIEKEKLPFINKSNHEHYSYYYNNELKKLVYNKFKEEIDFFNYKFDNIIKMKHFYQNIFGYFNFQDVYSMVVKIFPDDSHFVEIGSFLGCSSIYMAVEIKNSGKNIKFDCIDKWDFDWEIDGNLVNVYEEFLKNIKYVDKSINPIKGLSENVVKLYEDCSLDFVFIDADHEYDGVKKDIENWFEKVKKNGIIAGHDYVETFPGVIKAVDEFFGKENIIINNTSWIYFKK